MKRTPLSVQAVNERHGYGRGNPELARHMRAIAAQYELARAAIFMLSRETSRLAAVTNHRALSGSESSRAQSAELGAIIAAINTTLSDAMEPVMTATDALERLSGNPVVAASSAADREREDLVATACATLVHALGTGMENLDKT